MEVRYKVCFERLVPIERSRNIGNVRKRLSKSKLMLYTFLCFSRILYLYDFTDSDSNEKKKITKFPLVKARVYLDLYFRHFYKKEPTI